MDFQLIPKSVTLDDLNRRNDRRPTLALRELLSFLYFIIRLPVGWKTLSVTHELSFRYFLSIHRAQQRSSGWPSNVIRRFGRR